MTFQEFITKHKNCFYDDTLFCDNTELTDLHGIHKLPNLKRVFCYSNKLKTLDGIEKMSSLNLLVLFNNQITDINILEKFSNTLTQLSCSRNLITDFSIIKKFDKITHFDADDNPASPYNIYSSIKHLDLKFDYKEKIKMKVLDDKIDKITKTLP